MPESAPPSSPVTASPEAARSSAAPTSIPALSRAEVRELLFDLPWPELRALAHQCRLRHKGRHVHVRGLLEFSNVCRRNCRYCGLRHENRHLARYSLSAAELLRAASQAVAAGVDTLVLQSGETARNPLWLAQVVRGLKERFGLPVTLSVGEQPREWYALWREAGADRFLLKHETADARLYAALHPGYRLADRLRALSWLAELGYEVGSGFMVGVPGQRPESLVDDILLVRDMRVAMCGAGPFVPQADTPWGGSRAAPRSCACGSWPCCVWPCPGPTCPPPRRWPACAPKTGSGRALPRAATCSCLPSPRRRAGPPTASTTTRLWWTWTPCGAPSRAPGWSMRCRKLGQGRKAGFDGGGRGVFW